MLNNYEDEEIKNVGINILTNNQQDLNQKITDIDKIKEKEKLEKIEVFSQNININEPFSSLKITPSISESASSISTHKVNL